MTQHFPLPTPRSRRAMRRARTRAAC